MLAITPNDLLVDGSSETTPDKLALQRAMAALSALKRDDLERVAIMVEALVAQRA